MGSQSLDVTRVGLLGTTEHGNRSVRVRKLWPGLCLRLFDAGCRGRVTNCTFRTRPLARGILKLD
jgi:hypothetical protein